MTICDPSLMVDRRGPGKLPSAMSLVIVLACFVTFVAVAFGVSQLGHHLHVSDDWFRYGLTFVVAFCLFASWLPPAQLSRALRVAVLLPACHALVLALAWLAWRTLVPQLPDDGASTRLVTGFPIALVAAITAATFAAFASLVARRRSGEWIHGFAMLALSELLLLGLWLPIACAAWPGGHGEWWTPEQPLIRDVLPRVLLVVIPPTIVALAFTTCALRWPRALSRSLCSHAVFALIVIAIVARFCASARMMVLYTNCLPILFVAALVAITALLALGLSIWRRSLSARRVLARREPTTGTIADDGDEPVAGIEITSWLRGPRVVQRSFSVATKEGILPISGAHLAVALPASTTQLRVGECIAVLRPREQVALAGHAHAHGDPFRTSAAPITDDIVVATPERGNGFTQVALAMWRPCVAYLLIVTAIAVPGLVALLAT